MNSTSNSLSLNPCASAAERTQEIGILRAVENRRRQVARIILFETLAVGESR